MHKLTSKPITLDCFEIDDFDESMATPFVHDIIEYCETLRTLYLTTNDKRYWKELVRWLPESWLQTRTVTLTYENLRCIFFQRKAHKLNEWSGKDDYSKDNFIKWIMSLPYATELLIWEPTKPKSKKEELAELVFADWSGQDMMAAFHKFGIELLDGNGQMKPLVNILDELSQVWSSIDKT